MLQKQCMEDISLDVIIRMIKATTNYPNFVEALLWAYPDIGQAVDPYVRRVIRAKNCKTIKASGSVRYVMVNNVLTALSPTIHYDKYHTTKPLHISKAIWHDRFVVAPTEPENAVFSSTFTLRGYRWKRCKRWDRLGEIEIDGDEYVIWENAGHVPVPSTPKIWYQQMTLCHCAHHPLEASCPQCSLFSRKTMCKISHHLGGPACHAGAMCRCHHLGAHAGEVQFLYVEKHPTLEAIKDRAYSTPSLTSHKSYATVMPKVIPAIRSVDLKCKLPWYNHLYHFRNSIGLPKSEWPKTRWFASD